MNLIDRIAAALDNLLLRIDSTLFEECATDLLQDVYPNIVPVRGGSDSGTDADLLEAPGSPPVRMAVTSSRSYEGARKNLRLSIASLKQHKMPGTRIVSVSLADLNQKKRQSLEKLAKDNGYVLQAIIERAFFADRLRQHGEWREKLLGLPGGPFSLSKYSIRGDIAPHDFELVGRTAELETLTNLKNDILLYGVPGVGKSGLLEKLEDLYFVDGKPSVERLMDDIIATEPLTLVVDDAPRRIEVLENLQLIRRQESLSFRIIAVCWPHQREEIKVHMTAASEIELLPLIRPDIAAIVRDAGIARESLIARILEQARGRPAWARRLIDLLKSDGMWRKVQTGEAIRGEVSHYLTRSGLSKEARDVLAVIAILGTVAESEIGTLSAQLGLSRPAVAHSIDDLAVGGLLDVTQQWTRLGNSENVYSVAPQILATSIVVDTFFGAAPAIIPVHEIFDSWPTKQISIAMHCIGAELVGEQNARPIARSLFQALVQQGAIGIGSDIYRYYLYLGTNEAREIISRSTTEWAQSGEESQYKRENLLEFMATYFADVLRDLNLIEVIEDGLSFACTIDDIKLAKKFLSNVIVKIRNASIPDGSINLGPLFPISEASAKWFTASPSLPRSRALVMLLSELLNPAFESAAVSPEDARLVRLMSIVLPAESMIRLRDEVWTPFASLPVELGHDELVMLTDLFKAWAPIAHGFNPGINKNLSQEQIEESRTFAAYLADYLMAHCADFPGIRATIRRHAKELNREFPEQDSLIAAMFFVTTEEDFNWQERMESYESALSAAVQEGLYEPLVFMDRLDELRPHLRDWDQPLTNPLHTVFRVMARADTDLLPLLMAARDRGMFPEAGPLVGATLDKSDVDEALLISLLDDAGTRPFVVQYALTASASNQYLDCVVDRLTPDDLSDIFIAIRAGESPAPVVDRLLRHANPGVRAGIGAAILLSTNGELESVMTSQMANQVRGALRDLSLPLQIGRRDQNVFLELLITAAPDVYEDLLAKAIGQPPEDNIYKALQLFEDTAPRLDAEAKTRLLSACEPGTRERTHVLRILRDNDFGWLESLLEANLVDLEILVSTFDGFGPPVLIEGLARLLVTRGVDPLVVATKVELGSQWGEDHERLERYVEQMRALATSSEPALAAVGEAGLNHYEPLLEPARLRFREDQVRGR
ncbi:hypothetical protein [Mycobacterium marinum]|uniref:hypothetical protein n=1 Tax=Mycobacterium marinum TaxID=1781 RepID=UPI0023598D10|nr:hypothetical protein [Mycobacterium marinum]MDC9006467.1 hypothetical protein [Mycobacterium marinum]